MTEEPPTQVRELQSGPGYLHMYMLIWKDDDDDEDDGNLKTAGFLVDRFASQLSVRGLSEVALWFHSPLGRV